MARVSEDDQAGVSGWSFVCVCVSVFEHKHEKSASLYVPLTASLCLRVSVCPSLPVCVCLCLSLCASFSVCLCLCLGQSVSWSVGLSVGLSVGRSVGPSVCRSARRSVRLSVCRSVCLSPSVSVWCVSRKSVCLSVPAIPGPLTTTRSVEKAPWMTMDDEGRDENNTQDCRSCGLQTL